MTKPPAMPELPEPAHRGPTGAGAYFDSYTADQMRARDAMWAERLAALQSAQPAVTVSDDLLDRMEMEANAEANQNPHGTLYHWRKAYLRAFARAILALRPQAVPMTPEQMHDAYKQSPDSKNCMQCAAAYMLGLPMSAVPDFEKAGADAWESFEAFFADRGFTAEMFPPSVEIVGDYLASGDTARGTSHMVVMRGGELLHDPHPSNAGLKSVQAVWLITRRAGCRDGINQRADGGEVA